MARETNIGRGLVVCAALATVSCAGTNDPGPGTAPGPAIAITDSAPPASDRAVAFGNVLTTTTASATITVTSSGSAELVLGTVGLANPLAAPFAVVDDACSGRTLAPGTSCAIAVRFAPTATGPFADALDIPSDDATAPSVTVALGGAGVAPPAPAIAITDSVAPADGHDVAFGDVVQASAATATVTVTNAGSANLVLGTVGLADALSAPFELADDPCSGATLAPGASCVVTVRFAPTAPGSFGDSFDVASNDPAAPSVTVSVSGTGVVAPAPALAIADFVWPLDDRAVPFGAVATGASALETVRISNGGTADLLVGTIGSSTPLAAPFTIASDACSNRAMAPGASCSVRVRFAPTTAGSFTGSFDVPSNDPGAPFAIVTVSGIGVPPPPAPLARTGQSTCYTATGAYATCPGSGQDGDLQRGVAWPNPRFAAGTGAESACVTDHLTGLVWARSGNAVGRQLLWEQALDAIAALNAGAGLCGHTDWRLPNVNEMLTLVHLGEYDGWVWLGTQGFTNVQTGYWSSTTWVSPYSLVYAFTVNVSTGLPSAVAKLGSYGAWPVRAGGGSAPAPVARTGQTSCWTYAGVEIPCAGTGQDGELQAGVAWPAPRFSRNADTTIRDNLTGLFWAPRADTPELIGATTCASGSRPWLGAIDYIRCLNGNWYLGHSDWRLPNASELRSLGHHQATPDWLVGEIDGALYETYWTSDTWLGDRTYAFIGMFPYGYWTTADKRLGEQWVWPVRGP